jgi:two-component system, chemotaxis family, sensor kinase CheA
VKNKFKISPEMQAQLREIFLDEATTLVDQLEAALLVLERNPGDVETVNEAFRSAHTIKGSAAGAGFAGISVFTHELEYAFEEIRSQRLELNSKGLVTLLEAIDILRLFLKAARENTSEPDSLACLQHLSEQFPRPEAIQQKAMLPIPAEPDLPLKTWEQTMAEFTLQQINLLQDELASGGLIYQVGWVLPEDAFNFGIDPLVLLNALKEEAAVLYCHPILDRLPALEVLDPYLCYLGFDAIVASHVSEKDLREVFEFCPEGSTISFVRCEPDEMSSLAESLSNRPASKVGNYWQQIREQFETAASVLQKSPQGDTNLDASSLSNKPSRPENLYGDEGRTIRVKQERLDGFMNLVGEMVTARNTMLHLLKVVETEYNLPDLARRMKATTTVVNRTVSQLQTDVLNLRMVPLKTVFQRLPRVIRDVSAHQVKRVGMHLEGEDTEVDKTVADGLVDPLVHLIRNAIDHGIEKPADRLAVGKADEGNIWLSAWQDGKGVIIEIRDDGAGIDPQHIRQSAIEKGFLNPSEAGRLTDNESVNLIFTAGFSTNREVTEFSGRGVGMDVVRSNVSRMGGSVNVNSVLGQGTTIRLQVPLSLSLFRALVIHAGGETLALPLEAVRESVSINSADYHYMLGKPVAVIRGETVGLISLAEAMGFLPRAVDAGLDQNDRLVVVVESGGERIGLLVDSLDSPQEIMVKPLEGYLTARGAVAGASVMGDGRVALVLDPAGLVQLTLDYTHITQPVEIGVNG